MSLWWVSTLHNHKLLCPGVKYPQPLKLYCQYSHFWKQLSRHPKKENNQKSRPCHHAGFITYLLHVDSAWSRAAPTPCTKLLNHSWKILGSVLAAEGLGRKYLFELFPVCLKAIKPAHVPKIEPWSPSLRRCLRGFASAQVTLLYSSLSCLSHFNPWAPICNFSLSGFVSKGDQTANQPLQIPSHVLYIRQLNWAINITLLWTSLHFLSYFNNNNGQTSV